MTPVQFFLVGLGFMLAAAYWVACGLYAAGGLLAQKHDGLGPLVAILAIAVPIVAFLALLVVLSQA